MIIQIAAGILLAVFILGLIQELPDAFWYWFWGAAVVFLLYWFWPSTFFADMFDSLLAGLVFVGLIMLVSAPFIYLERRGKGKRKKDAK